MNTEHYLIIAWHPVGIHKLFKFLKQLILEIAIYQAFIKDLLWANTAKWNIKVLYSFVALLLHHVQVTNHMVSAGNGAVKPALGESWKTVPHVRLMISRENNICTATVLKHTLLVFFSENLIVLILAFTTIAVLLVPVKFAWMVINKQTNK